jgi:hypothetical protein
MCEPGSVSEPMQELCTNSGRCLGFSGKLFGALQALSETLGKYRSN